MVNQFEQIIQADKMQKNQLTTPFHDAYMELTKGKLATITLRQLRAYIKAVSEKESLPSKWLDLNTVESLASKSEPINNISIDKYDVIMAENDRYVENLDVMTASNFRLTEIIKDLMQRLSDMRDIISLLESDLKDASNRQKVPRNEEE